jgi:hypothetical protein
MTPQYGYNMSETVKVIKLTSGDELIARVTEETDSTITIKNIRTIQAVPTSVQGAVGMALVPYMVMVSDDDPISINKSNTLVVTLPKADIEKSYLSQVSGITL